MLTSLSRAGATSATEQLEAYDYARVLERTETFFWTFCDDYLELVKSRRYGDFAPEGAASANSAMLVALSTLLRLFAPYPAVRDRGSVVVVAARVGAPRALADAGRSGRADRRRDDAAAVTVLHRDAGGAGRGPARSRRCRRGRSRRSIERAVLPQRFERAAAGGRRTSRRRRTCATCRSATSPSSQLTFARRAADRAGATRVNAAPFEPLDPGAVSRARAARAGRGHRVGAT